MPQRPDSRSADLREDRRSKVAALLAAGVIRLVRSRIPDDATCLEFSGGSSLSVSRAPTPGPEPEPFTGDPGCQMNPRRTSPVCWRWALCVSNAARPASSRSLQSLGHGPR